MKKKEYDKKRYEGNKEYFIEQSKKYYRKNKKKILERQKMFNQKNKEHYKKYREQRRIEILKIVSGNNLRCYKCGCDDIRLLEINHKNGNGSKEIQRGKLSTKFLQNIREGKRRVDDLELLCRVCNALHYLELKFGKLPYNISYIEKGGK